MMTVVMTVAFTFVFWWWMPWKAVEFLVAPGPGDKVTDACEFPLIVMFSFVVALGGAIFMLFETVVEEPDNWDIGAV